MNKFETKCIRRPAPPDPKKTKRDMEGGFRSFAYELSTLSQVLSFQREEISGESVHSSTIIRNYWRRIVCLRFRNALIPSPGSSRYCPGSAGSEEGLWRSSPAPLPGDESGREACLIDSWRGFGCSFSAGFIPASLRGSGTGAVVVLTSQVVTAAVESLA